MTVSAETRFGRLIVKREIEPHVNSSGRRIRKFECFCDCGNICTIIGWELTRGNTKSCGCLHKEKMKKKFTTHGMSRSNIYAIWSLMVDRCNNRHTPGYKNYGGRGIKICKSKNKRTFRKQC